MRPRPVGAVVCAAVAALACAQASGSDRSRPASADVRARADPAEHPASDPARAPVGGVPVGYIGRTDDPAKSIAGVTYTPAPGGMWEVNSGTHDQNLSHIVYTPLDTATGTYAVRTEMDQIQTAVHPEAFGVFIGGRNLDGPAQKYGYFLLRSDGMYAIKVRDGREARVLVDFTASPHVAKANAAGQANYPITVRVATDSVRLFVGPDPVAAIARGRIPADGIVGLRVNHGLRLTVSPIVISR